MDPMPRRAAMSSATIVSAVGWVAFSIGVLAFLFRNTTQITAMMAVAFAGFGVWASCSAISGMLTGTIHGKYLSYSQADNPISFWSTVVFYVFVGMAMAYLASREFFGPGA
jgi:hypothetical protein